MKCLKSEEPVKPVVPDHTAHEKSMGLPYGRTNEEWKETLWNLVQPVHCPDVTM